MIGFLKVILELIIGLALCMWAALTFPGKFLSIHPDSDENRFVIMFLLNSLLCASVLINLKSCYLVSVFTIELFSVFVLC